MCCGHGFHVHVGLTWAHNPHIFKVDTVVISWVHTEAVKDVHLDTGAVDLVEEYRKIKVQREGVWSCGYCICSDIIVGLKHNSMAGFQLERGDLPFKSYDMSQTWN